MNFLHYSKIDDCVFDAILVFPAYLDKHLYSSNCNGYLIQLQKP